MDLASQRKHHVVAGAVMPENLAAELKEHADSEGKNQSLEGVLIQSLKPLLEAPPRAWRSTSLKRRTCVSKSFFRPRPKPRQRSGRAKMDFSSCA